MSTKATEAQPGAAGGSTMSEDNELEQYSYPITFLCLPPELRNYIYSLALNRLETKRVDIGLFAIPFQFTNHGSNLPLLRTGRQICHEASSILYHRTLLSMNENSLKMFVRRIPETAKRIQKFELRYKVNPNCGDFQYPTEDLPCANFLVALRRLEIEIDLVLSLAWTGCWNTCICGQGRFSAQERLVVWLGEKLLPLVGIMRRNFESDRKSFELRDGLRVRLKYETKTRVGEDFQESVIEYVRAKSRGIDDVDVKCLRID